MLEQIKDENVLFLDIETVPQYAEFEKVPEQWRRLWTEKSLYWQEKEHKTAAELYPKAGIWAEFGKIVCISAGVIYYKEQQPYFRIKSYFGNDESALLQEFNQMLDRNFAADDCFLCSHNGKEFDFPYIARRSLVNGIGLPKPLDIAGKKPWDVKHLDTMDLWRFGDNKNYTSLALLAAVFGLPSPKTDLTGADVWRVYWQLDDLSRIVSYCQADVLTVARLYLKYKGKATIPDENVIIA